LFQHEPQLTLTDKHATDPWRVKAFRRPEMPYSKTLSVAAPESAPADGAAVHEQSPAGQDVVASDRRFRRGRGIAIILLFLALLSTAGYLAHMRSSEGGRSTATASDEVNRPVSVRAAVVEARDMPVRIDEIGTVEPLATVAVKSRIDGLVVHVGFNEGDYVQANDVLFRLDDRTWRAQLAEAVANLARDRAQLADAQRILSRNEALAERGFAARATLDTARATVAGLEAAAAADAAQIENIRAQLDYTIIRAPIAGRTGAQAFKLGANVKANDTTPLVVINQTRPISVQFSVPQTELSALRAAQAKQALPVQVTVRGSRPVSAAGSLTFIDNAVNQASGTIALKATLANQDEALWPGQFVDVSVLVNTVPDVATLPANAILVGQQGTYVFVVKQDRTVEARVVEVSRTIDGVAFVSRGVAPGERVVIDNQLRLSPGSSVTVENATALSAPGEQKGPS
jgi:membrane fusion protein, multidrug efflux system